MLRDRQHQEQWSCIMTEVDESGDHDPQIRDTFMMAKMSQSHPSLIATAIAASELALMKSKLCPSLLCRRVRSDRL